MEDPKPVVRYVWEYKNFLEYVKKGDVAHAMVYAKALKIERKTLVHWMSQPELREALQKRIDKVVKRMETAGKDDWRMWRELLKMIGVDDEQVIDIQSNGEALQIATVVDLGAVKNATDKPKAEPDSPSDQEPQS